MDWTEMMLGQGAVPPAEGAVDLTAAQAMPAAAVAGPQFAQMMAPQPDMSTAKTPARNPKELGDRMTLWAKIAHKFQTDPNLQRSLMMMGAAMAQPIQPGQTPGGQFANSAMVGLNAYQMGQQADFARQVEMAKQGREDTRLGMEQQRVGLERERVEEAKKTGTVQRAATEAGTERTLLDLETAKETQADTIKRGHALAEKAVMELDEFKDEAHIRTAERALKEQELRVKNSIPDEVRQQAELDKINELRAKVQQAQAAARKTGAEADILASEAKLTPQERSKLKRTSSPTREEVQWGLLSNAWDESENLKKQFPDKNAWLAANSTESKTNRAQLLKAVNDALADLPPPRKGEKDPTREQLSGIQRKLLTEIAGGEATPQGFPTPGPRAIEFLKKNPGLKDQFEAIHGPGSSAQYLSGAPASAPASAASPGFNVDASVQKTPPNVSVDYTPQQLKSLTITDRTPQDLLRKAAKAGNEAARRKLGIAPEEHGLR